MIATLQMFSMQSHCQRGWINRPIAS
jgi:hypothetical protein